MKNLSLLFAAFLLIQLTTLAQTNWTKYEDNPVLPFGTPGSWDEGSSELGSVLFYDNLYHMWYDGNDGVNFCIGHATSPDGIIWTKDTLNNPVVDLGLPGNWDDTYVISPCVLLVDTTFHMWYAGYDGSYIERIGHATSPDGVEWTKDSLNKPVMDVGDPGEWDDTEVFPGPKSILFDGSIYKMWYGGTASNYIYKIGYATSPDGINWDKDTSNPVMRPGLQGSWDGACVVPSTVIFDGTTYHSWYSGTTEGFIKWRVGYATSSDGIDWEKDTLNNPVLNVGPFGSWDNASAWSCSVIFDTVYKMWYSGGAIGSGRIGYAYDTTVVSVETIYDINPEQFVLTQNYPNPFNPSTKIKYQIPLLSFITIKVYDVLGNEIITLVNEEKPAGTYEVEFNTAQNNILSTGVYFYQLKPGNYLATKKMILIK